MNQAEVSPQPIAPALPPTVEQTVDRLIDAFAPERVILFGSYARGVAQDNCNVDLLVIAEVEGSPHRMMRRARQLTTGCFPKIDVVLATPADAANASLAKSPVLHSILGSGITLYPRPLPDSAR